MLVSMDTHMLPLLLSLLLLRQLVTLSQLLSEDTKLLLDPTETSLDPSMRFPDSSLPLLFRNKSQAEMRALAPELVLLSTPLLFPTLARELLRLTLLSCTVVSPLLMLVSMDTPMLPIFLSPMLSSPLS